MYHVCARECGNRRLLSNERQTKVTGGRAGLSRLSGQEACEGQRIVQYQSTSLKSATQRHPMNCGDCLINHTSLVILLYRIRYKHISYGKRVRKNYLSGAILRIPCGGTSTVRWGDGVKLAAVLSASLLEDFV